MVERSLCHFAKPKSACALDKRPLGIPELPEVSINRAGCQPPLSGVALIPSVFVVFVPKDSITTARRGACLGKENGALLMDQRDRYLSFHAVGGDPPRPKN
jgi:hypothetical protein